MEKDGGGRVNDITDEGERSLADVVEAQSAEIASLKARVKELESRLLAANPPVGAHFPQQDPALQRRCL